MKKIDRNMDDENHMDDENQKPSSQAAIPTVDQLVDSLSCIIQVDLANYMNPITKVVGRVKSVSKTYGKYVYISLIGNESSIAIKCPSSLAPNIGDDLVFEGRVGLKPNTLDGVSFEMSARPVEAVVPYKRDKPTVVIQKDSYISLETLIQSKAFSGIAVLGTKTAISDVRSSAGNHHQLEYISFHEVSTTSDKLASSVLAVLNTHPYSGFMVVRGGDDQSLNLWDRPEFVKSLTDIGLPFYLGLGHSHKMMLANQYADGSFPTPSICGAKLNEVFTSINNLAKQKQSNEDLHINYQKQIKASVFKSAAITAIITCAVCYFVFLL